MSLDPMLWALKDAPVANVEERAILGIMGERAHEDGTASYLSATTMATRALVDRRTVRRRLAEMESRGLIARGDQRLVDRIPQGKRPVVYDLMIPYSWFSNISRVNSYREEHGKPPLTPADRPDIAPPTPKKTRRDFGVPRPRSAENSGSEDEDDDFGQGGLQVTPDETDILRGLEVTGDYESTVGCLQVQVEVTTSHPISSLDSPQDSPHPPTPREDPLTSDGAGAATEGGETEKRDEKGEEAKPDAERIVAAVCRIGDVPPARWPRGRTLKAVAAQISAKLAGGWAGGDLVDALSGDMTNVGNVRKVLEYRLAELGPPPPPPPVVPPRPAYVPGRAKDDGEHERLLREGRQLVDDEQRRAAALAVIRETTGDALARYREVADLPLAEVRARRAGADTSAVAS